MQKNILQLAKRENPNIDFDKYQVMLTGLPLDHAVVDKIFDVSVSLGDTKDLDLRFVAAMLIIFSPKSILLEEKTVFGVAKAILKKLNLSHRFGASYRIRVARGVYEVDSVFRSLVDQAVKEVRDER